MKALVTGATRFLGSHIVERLVQKGNEVHALVRPTSDTSLLREWSVELVTGDVTQAESLAAATGACDCGAGPAGAGRREANVAEWL